MKLWEKYLIEGLFFKPEKEEVKELREKGLTVYFYHGTDLRKSGDIKRYGLLPSKQESYVHQAIGDFENITERNLPS
jgi:RNA:NAD 2'-phosphotransferase (TPT1/KptA family)